MLDEVRRGVDLLDKQVPDWREMIDTENLLMQHCRRCVLGQIFGEYFDGKHALGIDDVDGSEFGFSADGSDTDYDNLNALWRIHITQPPVPPAAID